VIRISKSEPPWGGQDNADFQIVVKQREASTHSAPSVFVLKSWAVSQIDGDACAGSSSCAASRAPTLCGLASVGRAGPVVDMCA
jgi:hypothetical protein